MPFSLASRLATAVLPLALAVSAAVPGQQPGSGRAHAPNPVPQAATATSAGYEAAAGTSASGAARTGSVAAAKARGNPRAYAFLSRYKTNSVPVARWDPCGGPIDYRVNLSRAPSGALRDVQGAIKRISSASGLRFRYRGTTNVFPWAARGYRGTFPADTELIIAWAVPGKHSRALPKPARGARGPAGVGGPMWYPAHTRSGRAASVIVQGQVVLDATLKLRGGFGTGPRYGLQGTRGKLLMHEIGHAIGLAHPKINDAHQVMYPLITREAGGWGAGDRNGLKIVGSRYGCLYRGSAEPGAAAAPGPQTRIQP